MGKPWPAVGRGLAWGGAYLLSVIAAATYSGAFVDAQIITWWLVGGLTPLFWSVTLASDDPRYGRDFTAGLPWFAFLWSGELLFYLSCEAGAYPLAVTRAAVPFYSMMFAIGVVRSHTSLTDLITPGAGMAAGFRKMEHPRKVAILLLGLAFPMGAILLAFLMAPSH